MKNLFKNLGTLALLGLVLTLAPEVKAQSFHGYDGGFLVGTNLVLTNASPGTAIGSSNLVTANYPQSGAFCSLHGVSANNPLATGVTFQFTYVTPSSNNISTNCIWTIQPVLDQFSVIRGVPAATGSAFTITNAVPQVAGTNTFLVFVSSTNFLGCEGFKVSSVNYVGTNVSLTIPLARYGLWY